MGNSGIERLETDDWKICATSQRKITNLSSITISLALVKLAIDCQCDRLTAFCRG